MSALERIAGNASAKTLTDALAASTDVGSLAQLLSRSDVVGSAAIDLDPLAPMLARNVEHRQKLLQLAGGALSAEEAGRTLGITRQAVDKRRRARTLLAVREGSDWRDPACQFHEGENKTFQELPTSSRASQQRDHGPRSTSCWLPARCSRAGRLCKSFRAAIATRCCGSSAQARVALFGDKQASIRTKRSEGRRAFPALVARRDSPTYRDYAGRLGVPSHSSDNA